MVRGVLVCACACVWVAATTAAEVRQEVDRIFKTVESHMSGVKKMELPTSETKKSHLSSRADGFKEGDSPGADNTLSTASDRAYPGPVTFPVGVILSDNLYPLVVGRHVETGMPFVMNLNKQHALVVARGGSADYRMLIPFPVVSPQPQDDTSESQYRSAPPVVPKRYPLKTPYYPLYSTNVPKKYLVNHQTYGKYYDEPLHIRHPTPSTPRVSPYGPSKVPVKYASNYQSYRDYDSDDAGKFDDTRYKQSPPKKYIQSANYINYFGVDHKPIQAVTGKYVPYSIDHPVSKYRVRNYTRYLSHNNDISYHVAGPKYTPTQPFTNTYNSQPQSYRTTSHDGPSGPSSGPPGPKYTPNQPFTNTYNSQPQSYRTTSHDDGPSGPSSGPPGPKYTPTQPFTNTYNSQPQSYRTTSPDGPPPRSSYLVRAQHQQYSPPRQTYGSSGHPDDDPSEFKPSPYLGSIPEDEPSTKTPLETQSEEFDSYDDREPDYTETSSRSRPGSSAVGMESTGGVRHVTHHADDYLGKIYEDMYYKVAPNTYSDGPPSYEAEESQQPRNATETRTGPVTFNPPDNHH